MCGEAVLVGLDIGASAVDACAFTLDARPVATATAPLVTHYPHPGWAEQSPAAWIAASRAALRGVCDRLGSGARIAALGLAGQCPSCVLVDQRGTPQTAGLIYQDNRAQREAQHIADVLGAAAVRARTGLWPSQFLVAPKILWLVANCPDLRGSRLWLAQPRDLVGHWLTDVLATDPTHAGCTGLYDLDRGDWMADWIERLDLHWLGLPPILPAQAILGGLCARAAGDTGLPVGLPVCIGAADNFCADLAIGAIAPGILGDISGTSTCLDLTLDQLDPAPQLSLYRHLLPGLYFANNGMNATGATLAWAAAALASGDLARLEALAAAAPPDPAAPLLLPYLADGERADAGARGLWQGLSLRHDPARLARSVYEGLTFALHDLIDDYRRAGYSLAEARVAGGGSQSALWCRLKADVWSLPVHAAAQADATALGAALLAGAATGTVPDLLRVVARTASQATLFEPDPDQTALYSELYHRWRKACRQFRGRDA
jgi:xylulokinase